VASPRHDGADEAGRLGAGAGDQGHELLAAEARDHIAWPEPCAQHRGHGDQDAVANLVTVPIVHGLEVIEIHEQDTEAIARLPALVGF
jgi:hypothetical protein